MTRYVHLNPPPRFPEADVDVQGKDATFLCSLNNFDAYYVTRVHKAPKPYVFSVKSTDSLTYFENTSDYVHVFSCGESEGKNWLEKILLARVRPYQCTSVCLT